MSNIIDFPHEFWLNAHAQAIHETVYLMDIRKKELARDVKKAMDCGLDATPYAEQMIELSRRRKIFMEQMESVLDQAKYRGVDTDQILYHLNAIHPRARRLR